MRRNDDIEYNFESIYKKYYSGVYGFILKRVSNVQDAEDLSNEVFYACMKNFEKYDPAKAPVVSWLYAIAKNKLKNFYRDKKDTVSIDNDDSPIELPYEDDLEASLRLTEMRKALAQAISQLPQRERSVIIQKYFSDRSPDEIAAELELSPSNFRVIVHRALQKLRNHLINNNWER